MTNHRLQRVLMTVACGLCLGASNGVAWAQSQAQRVPPPAEISLTTKDGVQLKATYYPSNAGQDAVPVIMLHDFAETRAVLEPLALALQNPRAPASPAAPKMESRAVVTVDLRGHGDSKTAFAADGSPIELEATRFEVEDFESMVVYDVEAVRSFLVEQNDAGMLNLNKLCIVGSGMGANVAILWAARDWSAPPLPVRKQGQDVKALALLSPQWNFKGLILRDAMKFPPVQQDISVFLAYGRADRKAAEDVQDVEKVFARYHPEPPADQVQLRKDFFVYDPDTRLQGTKLLNSREFAMGPKFAAFIEARLGGQNFPWLQRKKP